MNCPESNRRGRNPDTAQTRQCSRENRRDGDDGTSAALDAESETETETETEDEQLLSNGEFQSGVFHGFHDTARGFVAI